MAKKEMPPMAKEKSPKAKMMDKKKSKDCGGKMNKK
jgi:hypothetical protein